MKANGQPLKLSENGTALREQATAAAAASMEQFCTLCGLACLGRGLKKDILGVACCFCCPGCLHVYDILANLPEGPPSDFRNTDLFRQCVQAGIIPSDPRNGEGARVMAPPGASVNDRDGVPAELAKELRLQISGMWCSACAWLIEALLKRTRGILGVQISFLTDLAVVTYLPHEVSIEQIRERVARAGYAAAEFGQPQEKTREENDMLLHLGIAAILTLNIMMISACLYYGFIEDIETRAIRYFSLALLLLTTPVIFYCGRHILQRALSALRQRTAGMDSLVALSALAAYGYSILRISHNSLHLYFDTAAMLITMVLLGKFIEYHARRKVTAGLSALYQLARQKVRLIFPQAYPRERWVAQEAVPGGSMFAVQAGERIPLDGRVETGTGLLDRSMLTGETRPISCGPGESVLAGCILIEGGLTLQSVRTASQSSFNQMIRLTQAAIQRKNAVEVLADRLTRWIVPLVLLIATATALMLGARGVSLDEALLRAVTVLLITCPCALGIAIPLAKVAALGVARQRGFFVRDAQALEDACKLDVLMLDKTGTLTEGCFHLRHVLTVQGSEDELLRPVAAIEVGAEHFVAREIVACARRRGLELPPAQNCRQVSGCGAVGQVEGHRVSVGNRKMMQMEGVALTDDLRQRAGEFEESGHTALFCAIDGRLTGLLLLGDRIKPNSPAFIARLKKMGIVPWLISGDSRATTRAVALQLGIDHFVGEALPEEKMAALQRLQQQGHRVGMLGDGINDASALAHADVGFALGAGTDLLREASDVTLLSDDPLKFLEVYDLAAKTRRIVRQNLAFAFLYNVCGIPLAVMGLLNPFLAVVAMFASSLSVIGNSLRLSRS